MTTQKQITRLAPLVPPTCNLCGRITRLIGIEPASTDDHRADLCTYECQSCGEFQTRLFLRTPKDQLNEALAREYTGGASNGNAVEVTASLNPLASGRAVGEGGR